MHLFLYRAFVHHPRELVPPTPPPPHPSFCLPSPTPATLKMGTNVSSTLGHLMTGPPWGYAGSPLRNALGCPILELQWQPHFWLNSNTGAGVTCANWQCVLLTLFFSFPKTGHFHLPAFSFILPIKCTVFSLTPLFSFLFLCLCSAGKKPLLLLCGLAPSLCYVAELCHCLLH